LSIEKSKGGRSSAKPREADGLGGVPAPPPPQSAIASS